MEEFGKIADCIKQQLTSNDRKSRNQSISGLLKTLQENCDEKFVMQLVYKGVIRDLIKNIEPVNNRELLKCLEIIVKRDCFYTNHLVDEAILGIKKLRCIEFVEETIYGITKLRLIESVEEAATAVNIFNTIVTKVFKFHETQGILLINKHADGLLNLITRVGFDSASLLSAMKLFNFVVDYSTEDFKLTNICTISSTYSSTMKFLLHANDISNLEKINTVFLTTISQVTLCNQIDDEFEAKLTAVSSGESNSVHQIPSIKKDLIEAIRITITKYVIPIVKVLEMDIKTADNFVELLRMVIKIQAIKDKKLCVHLLREGYLKYLLELSLFYPESPSFRSNVCRVISEIIVTLKEYLELPIDYYWKDGIVAFQNYLCIGFESLPADIKKWEHVLGTYDQKSNSLLILLFCHFIGTDEQYIFSKKSLAINLMSFAENCREPVILRALWLLYSVAALYSKICSTTSDIHLCKNASLKLANALQNVDKLELVYTHIDEVLLFSMQEICFPEVLRIKIISLWLENSESEKEFDIFIKECLEQGYEEFKIVKLLMCIVHGNCITNLTNALNAYGSLLRFKQVIPEDAVEFIWKTLSEDLENYTPSYLNILKTVLRFVSSLPPTESVSAKILRKCATDIAKIVIREDTDLVLKTLLINAAAFALRQSVIINDSKVADIFLKKRAFLQEVYDSGFTFRKSALTNISIRTLACLMACQIKFSLKSDTISELTFKDLETLLLDLKENKCFTIFGVELIKFLMRSEVENPVIRLRRLEKDSDLLNIYNVYFFIHAVHAETLPGEEDQTYQCLSTMLNYCFAQKLDIGIFLMCSATPLLMELAITGFPVTKRISSYFLDFATTWLGYLKNYRAKTNIQIESLPEDSVELLVQFVPFVLKLDDNENVTVRNFLRAISGYTKS